MINDEIFQNIFENIYELDIKMDKNNTNISLFEKFLS